uniref:Putative cell division topological specificity factor MinE, calycin n=1 Tax=Tanacetum cinerariifolium TaxID=118510 RepID=A0A699IPC3_TANCI|nr:putative cell division topological specificity factor MinE, calycin [Tanacetum cinerariifolium]
MSSSSCLCRPFYTTPNSLFTNPKPYLRTTCHKPLLFTKATKSSSSSSATAKNAQQAHESMSIDALKRFIRLNLGNWTGSFHQFDPQGKLLHKIDTRLSAGSYGENELISLLQTLYIKQAASSYSSSEADLEAEWAEYKIKETNMFTAEKYQQIGFFPQEKAFALRYQTAGMLENILRQGVLGEDDIGEESPKNLKLPSKFPSIVCECCLYSLEKDLRARAFHIMDPKGFVEMLILFLEEKGVGVVTPPFLDESKDSTSRITPHLGTWKGHSVTKRSGVYGATEAEAETVTLLDFDENGQLVQDQTSTYKDKDAPSNVRWTGTVSDNLVSYDGGYQITLLPGGLYMGCPRDVGKHVADTKSFHLELCWLESPTKRQRLVRTFDVDGLAVSTTYFLETKV